MISSGEIFMLFLVVLLLFGSKGIPDAARTMGKIVREFRKATGDIKKEFENSPGGSLRQEFEDIKKSVVESTQKIGQNINSMVDDVENEAGKIADNTNKGLDYIENEVEEIADNTNNYIENKANELTNNTSQNPNDLGYDYGYSYYNSDYGYGDMNSNNETPDNSSSDNTELKAEGIPDTDQNPDNQSHDTQTVEVTDDQKSQTEFK